MLSKALTRWIFSALLCVGLAGLLLAGCTASTPLSSSRSDNRSDLNVAGIQAEGTLGVVRAWQTSTAQAFAVATLQAAQTQDAYRATDTAEAKQATATQQAFDTQRTLAAEANLTEQARATQAAQIAASQTQAARVAMIEHATATAIYLEQREAEVRAQWSETVAPIAEIAPTFLGIIIAVLVLIALVRIFKAVLPALEIWAMTRRTPGKGAQEEYLIERGKDGLKIYMPNRAAGSAMRTTPEGAITVDGISPYGPDWTDTALSREQAIRMAATVPEARREIARRMANAAMTSEAKGYAVLPDSHPAVQALLPDKDILDAEWREVDQS